MGPLLIFRGSRPDAWLLSALVATDARTSPENLVTSTGGAQAQLLARHRDHALWRYDFSLSRDPGAPEQVYALGDRSWAVCVPTHDAPLRFAFTACNGSERDDTWRGPAERNALWTQLASEHERSPFHLLLQGGDQLYADPIWRAVPALASWRRLSKDKRRAVPFSPEMRAQVEHFYFDSYRRLWAQAELAPLLASVPSLMMWDDHDILDGWGSYSTDMQHCAVVRGIWTVAREHFALFQLGCRPEDLPAGFAQREGEHFGWAYRVGEVGVIAPDLRSERTRERVMGETGWRDFQAMLESLSGCRHVLLVSTVPLVNAHLTSLERVFGFVPGHQSWQDDLLDQWVSLAHWEEWGRMLATILAFSARTGARVTSLSGEIHLGAFGTIDGLGARVHQLTASGIVHPPPSAALVHLLDWRSRSEFEVTDAIRARLLPLPGSTRRYIRARNWLSLAVREDMVAQWHVEGGSRPILLPIPAGPF